MARPCEDQLVRTVGTGLVQEHAQVEVADPLWGVVHGIEVEPKAASRISLRIGIERDVAETA